MPKPIASLLAIAVLVLATNASAQNAAQINASADTLLPLLRSFGDTHTNYLQLAKELPTAQLDDGAHLESLFSVARANATFILELAALHGAMKNEHDRTQVAIIFRMHVEAESNTCRDYPAVMNRFIAHLSSGAVLAEARDARDQSQKICRAITQLAPPR